MGQREMRTTTGTREVETTIALGSMLVFASVMPPLDTETATDSRKCPGAAGQDDFLDLSPDELSA